MRYTVRAGDTVASIAQRFRVDVDDVLRLNPSIFSAPEACWAMIGSR